VVEEEEVDDSSWRRRRRRRALSPLPPLLSNSLSLLRLPHPFLETST
jgi:hypothetical protein